MIKDTQLFKHELSGRAALRDQILRPRLGVDARRAAIVPVRL